MTRVQAVLRRDQRHAAELQPLAEPLSVVEGPNFTVALHQQQLILSEMELTLLRGMVARANELLTAPDLLHLLGKYNRQISPQEIHQNIRSIALKLENNFAGKIEILPGFRYRMSKVL